MYFLDIVFLNQYTLIPVVKQFRQDPYMRTLDNFMVDTVTFLLGMVSVGRPGHCVEAKAKEAGSEDTVGEGQQPGGRHRG